MENKNSAASFFLGLIVGIVGCYFATRTKALTVDQPPAPIVQTEPAQAHPPDKPKAMELFSSAKAEKAMSQPEKPKEETIPPEQTPEVLSQNASIVPKLGVSSLQISLAEDAVAMIEEQWGDLPRQAEASREDRGWRITRLQAGTLLSASGLKEGDLVTASSLEAFAQANEDASLALRVENILNHISR